MPLFNRLSATQVECKQGASVRSQADKNSDLVSCLDHGAATTKSAADNTTAINAAIAATTTGFVLVPPGISYTEASLVMVDGVSLLIFSSNGVVTILTKNQGTTLPITKGGLAIKSQNHDGILLRAHDSGIAGDPYVQVLDLESGDLAFVNARTFVGDRDSGGIYFLRDGSGQERWSLGHADLGTGSTKDLAIYGDANDDGIIETLFAYFIRKGASALQLRLLGALVVGDTARAAVYAGALDLTGNGANWIDIAEIAEPAAPAANQVRLFIKDSGAGKTQLCAKFNTGAVQVIATQP